MEVSFPVLWYSRGPAFPPELGRVVGYLTEVKAGRGPWFARIWVGVVPGFPGVTCFGVGVIWASGAGELAGNGVVAAPGRCVAVSLSGPPAGSPLAQVRVWLDWAPMLRLPW